MFGARMLARRSLTVSTLKKNSKIEKIVKKYGKISVREWRDEGWWKPTNRKKGPKKLEAKGMRHPGIEPGASRWQRDILPLNQWRASYPHTSRSQSQPSHILTHLLTLCTLHPNKLYLHTPAENYFDNTNTTISPSQQTIDKWFHTLPTLLHINAMNIYIHLHLHLSKST
jgi:hypothetical protein